MAGFQKRALASSLVLISLLLGLSEAKDLLVGGKLDAWKIPSSQSDSLNQWAESSRFRIGDSLGKSFILLLVHMCSYDVSFSSK